MNDGSSIYPDGSGLSCDELQRNLDTIAEREAVLRRLRVFIANHQETLAGMSWRVAYLDPEIELWPTAYRGKYTTARQFAQLCWPGVTWHRHVDKYDKERRDWLATVDGVTLRIKSAERIKPLPQPRDGGVVNLQEVA